MELQKWEYQVVIVAGKRKTWEPMLNELGAQGWEAVSASATMASLTVLLKRPTN